MAMANPPFMGIHILGVVMRAPEALQAHGITRMLGGSCLSGMLIWKRLSEMLGALHELTRTGPARHPRF